MTSYKKSKKLSLERKAKRLEYIRPTLFPRPICLEECTINLPSGYEKDIFRTLKSFSNEEAYKRKRPHQLKGDKKGLYSLDVKGRHDKYRLLFYEKDSVCKITTLSTEETH